MRVYSYSENDGESTNETAKEELGISPLSNGEDEELSLQTWTNAQRELILQDSWNFFRMICSLLRDWHKYDEAFIKITNDPLYPYLNSLVGINDTGEIGVLGVDSSEKLISQNYHIQHEFMTMLDVCKEMVENANNCLLSLIKVCRIFAKVLGLKQVGVGPVKDVEKAMRKAERKYKGDVLMVTDYCRALLVVKDLATLLAALELAQKSFRPLIRRIKLSTLKFSNKPSPGGYRSCVINIELQGHICEIQIHLWDLWKICGKGGFRHYRHCLDYGVDSTFDDPFQILHGLEKEELIDLITIAEHEVLGNNKRRARRIKWYHEERILSYFCKVGLYFALGAYDIAEPNLIELIRLRSENPEMGPNHIETIILQDYLEQALRLQNKIEKADQVKESIDQKTNKDSSRWFTRNVCRNLPFCSLDEDNKQKYLQRDEVIEESMHRWKEIRRKNFLLIDEVSIEDIKLDLVMSPSSHDKLNKVMR